MAGGHGESRPGIELSRSGSRIPGPRGTARLSWLIVLLSFVLTYIAWSVSTRALEQRNAQRFGRQADKVIDQFVEQLQGHAAILTAGAGLMMASERVTREEW